jgi:type II secretory pathway pseudopilin PulG
MLKNKPTSTSPSRGFTIVEMLIIAPIVLLTIGAFVTVIVNMTGDVLATRSSNVLAYSIQDALNRIEDDIKLSTTFLEANNVSLTGSHQGFDNNVANFANVDNGTTTNGNMLILNTLATTGNPLSSTSGLVYLANQPNACASAQVNQNTPMTMNIVYFVKTVGGTSSLWRRSIMPSNYATAGCVVPWQQPSCAPGITDSFCKTQDVRLVDGINPSDFVVQYFNTADATAANVAAVDPTSATNRHVALQSTQTASATINTSKTVAGRQISQAGTMRATRLDINSSTIATVATPTTPVAPTVTGVFLAPDSANFTWPTVPGASTYTLNYSIAGGSYVNGFTNSTNTSFTMSALRNQSICVTVYANNSAGTSPFGSACTIIPLWNGLVYQNNWNDYANGYASGAYTKTSAGVVVLKGLVKTSSAGTTIAQLPPGYRPSEDLIFQTTTTPNVASRVDVSPAGNIILSVGSTGWVSLDGIKFIPSTSSYTFTDLSSSLLNSWTPYNAPSYAAPGYVQDSNGRIHIKGLVKNGSGAIATLPVGYRPALDQYFPADATNAFGDVTVQAGGSILPVVYTNPYFSLQVMYYPASYPNGTDCTISWCTLGLQNGWVYYGGLSTPAYTKAPDGIVTVKGFIKSGTTTSGTVIANLPVGYRPKEIILLASTGWNVHSTGR